MTSHPRIETRLTADYGVDHPIAAAAMAFVGTAPDLAIAVCQAGGIGSLAVGPLPAEAVRHLIGGVKQATDRPYNVNFITIMTREDQIAVCVDERVPIVSFHWGHPPQSMIDALRDAGIRVWEQVGSVEAARRAVDDGVDLIVAQGSEAGGHNYGSLPTFVLVPEIVRAVAPTPVLAAGGISTGRQILAALVLGADGAWIGTRLVASREAQAHPRYKTALVEAAGTETRLTSVYGPETPDFNPMRVLDRGLAREFAGKEESAPTDLDSQPVIATMRLAGEELPLQRFSSFVPTPDTDGDVDDLPFLSGQGVGLIDDVPTVKAIIDGMMAEAIDARVSIGRGGDS